MDNIEIVGFRDYSDNGGLVTVQAIDNVVRCYLIRKPDSFE